MLILIFYSVKSYRRMTICELPLPNPIVFFVSGTQKNLHQYKGIKGMMLIMSPLTTQLH